MSEDILYCCKIFDNSKNPNITTEFLNTLEIQFSTLLDKEKECNNYHVIYSENSEDSEKIAKIIEAKKEDWKEFDIFIDNISTFSIKQEEWAEVWKKYFTIEHITERIVIKPSWLEYEAKDNDVVLKIDPGMSFGTGKHPTTSFCLKILDKLSSKMQGASYLDAGSGSGILSIAAYKLGYAPISAFDIDDKAVEISLENFAENEIPKTSIDVQVADLANYAKTAGKFDLVNANILSHILLQNREMILSFMKSDGYLILAGILSTEYKEFSKAFCDLGLVEIETLIDKEWQSGLFKFAIL